MPVLNTGLAKVSGEAFTIDQSLRFDVARDTNLTKTWGGEPTLGTKYTVSCWVKVCQAENTYQTIYSTAGGDENEDIVSIYQTGGVITFRITWENSAGSPAKKSRRSYQVFRDPSAWYHMVFAWDSTQGTPADRLKVYVNNELVTPWRADISEGEDPDENEVWRWNANGETCSVGYGNVATSEFDGYIAEFHNIDGTALTPSSFGEAGDYGEWKPKKVEGLTYGDNGFYLSFAGGGIMSATGGDSTDTDGDYKAASFTQDGTFTPSADGEVEYLVIAGGGSGGGGNYFAGGGGAGGFRTGYLAVTGGTAYSITVGDGGAGGSTGTSNNGSNSVFSSITSIGGGGGGLYNNQAGKVGGSGGGGAGYNNEYRFSGAGTAGQGYAGGDGHGASIEYSGGGGGGASAVGGDGTSSAGGVGGAGLASSITGSSVTYAGGGGGSGNPPGTAGAGGAGGGGAGSTGAATNGTANTGGGGGGAEREGAATSGAGGSGIVIIRYKFQ